MDHQGQLGQKDNLVYVETLAPLRSSPSQEVRGHLAHLENQGCKENLAHQGHQEAQDLVGQKGNLARMGNQEFLDQLEKKATKVLKESKDHLGQKACQV